MKEDELENNWADQIMDWTQGVPSTQEMSTYDLWTKMEMTYQAKTSQTKPY